MDQSYFAVIKFLTKMTRKRVGRENSLEVDQTENFISEKSPAYTRFFPSGSKNDRNNAK